MIRKKTQSWAKKRVLLVDDHPMMRQGLAQLINNEPDLLACYEAGTAAEALALVNKRGPDLVLVDISLPDRSGIDLVRDLHALRPELPVLIVSMHDEAIFAERALRAGALGYIMKQEGGKRMMEAIRRVLSGQISVSEHLTTSILASFADRRPECGCSPIERLTDREFEVFHLLGQGRTTREIADQLHLSPKTVEVHRLHIKRKLQLASAAGLIRHAVCWVEAHQPQADGRS